jgi:mono/diheme cytochrome c family protein
MRLLIFNSRSSILLALAVSTLSLAGCDRRGNFSPVDMWNRSRYKPLEPTTLANVNSSSQMIPPGTVYRGQIERDKLYPPAEDGMTVREMQAVGRVRETPDSNAINMTGADSRAARSLMVDGALVSRHGASGVRPNMGPTGDYRVRGGGATMTRFPFPVTKEVLLRGQERFNIYCAPCHGMTGDGDGMIVRRGFSQPPTYHQERLRKAPVGHFFDVITNGYGAMYSYASRVSPEDRWAIIAYIRALQLARDAKMSDVPAGERGALEKLKTAPSAEKAGAEKSAGTE